MTTPAAVTAEELVRAVEAGEPIQILDIRAPERLAGGRVDIVPESRFVNFVGSRLLQLDDLAVTGPRVSVPGCWPAMAAEALQDACEEGYDGIIAKRLSSPYLPGRRSRDWIKIKNLPDGVSAS